MTTAILGAILSLLIAGFLCGAIVLVGQKLGGDL